MPRNFNRYQYETSPRKLKPEYTPAKNPYKQKKTTINKNELQQKNNKVKKKKHNKAKVIMYTILAFSILFAITYRNAQIDENFSEVQNLKEELAILQKENEQLEEFKKMLEAQQEAVQDSLNKRKEAYEKYIALKYGESDEKRSKV